MAPGSGSWRSTTRSAVHRVRLSRGGVHGARRPGTRVESALLAAKMAGHSYISIDGTLIETDRCRTPGPPRKAWTCSGRANTPTMAGTSRSSPLPTAGRCGHRRCGRAASTTPPRCASIPRSCPLWLRGSPRTGPRWAVVCWVHPMDSAYRGECAHGQGEQDQGAAAGTAAPAVRAAQVSLSVITTAASPKAVVQ